MIYLMSNFANMLPISQLISQFARCPFGMMNYAVPYHVKSNIMESEFRQLND